MNPLNGMIHNPPSHPRVSKTERERVNIRTPLDFPSFSPFSPFHPFCSSLPCLASESPDKTNVSCDVLSSLIYPGRQRLSLFYLSCHSCVCVFVYVCVCAPAAFVCVFLPCVFECQPMYVSSLPSQTPSIPCNGTKLMVC